MHNAVLDQQEAEVADLVLQNKLQISKPPPEAVMANVITEQPAVVQRPNKWEFFLVKEENDDQVDCSSEISLDSVSSTTFDRERINCPQKTPVSGVKRKWSNTELDTSAIGRSSSNINIGTYFANDKVDLSLTSSQTQKLQNTATQLSNCHRKPYRSGTFPTKRFEYNSPERLQHQQKAVEALCKRKQANSTIPPMMNFGKRSTSETNAAPPTENQLSENLFNKVKVFKTTDVTEPEIKPASTSSKWVKYLKEDDETNENAIENFITF
uniref:Uncharacterized protein n=1 Tax=Anopheles farauti TaxID=69004 RepID=A0A3F2YX43_9DIPT